jgi:hypothetical protein
MKKDRRSFIKMAIFAAPAILGASVSNGNNFFYVNPDTYKTSLIVKPVSDISVYKGGVTWVDRDYYEKLVA